MSDTDGPTLYGHDKYHDITEEFTADANNLESDELCHDPSFTLLDGVHALEIGNEKMDTGLKYRELVVDLQNSPTIETARDALEIIDLLLSTELTWHSGPMLLQTVLSNIYVEKVLTGLGSITNVPGMPPFESKAYLEEYIQDRLSNIKNWNDIVEIYILGLAKSIDQAIALMDPMSTNAIYPEEDIIINRSGICFLDQVNLEIIAKALEASAKWARSKAKGSKDQIESSVSDRLKLRTEWLYILSQKVPKKPTHLLTAKTLLESVIKSIDPEQSVKSQFEKSFSDGVQTRVMNPSPLLQLKRILTLEAYNNLLIIIESIEGFRALFSIDKSSDLLAYYLSFSEKQNPRPLPIIRAILRLVVGQNEILGVPFKQWVIRDIQEMSCPSYDSLLKSNTPSIKRLIDPFLAQASLCYTDLLAVFCQNRPRQRQNLSHCILSWDSLQVSAENLEEALEPLIEAQTITLEDNSKIPALPISSWVYLRKLQVMVWVVLLGFELDVYKQWEFPTMYSYGHYLISKLREHLSRIRVFLEQTNQRTSARYISALELESMALDQITMANQYLSFALQLAEIIPNHPSAITTSPELLHGLRMKPFSSVGIPEAPSYKEIHDTLHKSAPTIKLALEFSKHFADSCRSLVSNLSSIAKTNPGLDLLKRSSVNISLTGSELKRILDPLKEDEDINKEIALIKQLQKKKPILKTDKCHPFFPVITLAQKGP